jgi:hypothetical protein
MDIYLSSTALFFDLCKRKINCHGMVSYNRKNKPPNVMPNNLKMMRGVTVSRYEDT